MTLNLHLKTVCLQITALCISMLGFGSLSAQCIDNVSMTTVELANNAPDCNYKAEICVDIIGSPDHVNIEINSSAGLYSQTVPSYAYDTGKACYTFFLNNIPCGEMVSYAAYGYDTPSFTSVCGKENAQRFIGSPLAVEFAHFDGHFNRGNVVLEWVTASETESDFFQIEYSRDGSDYTALGKVFAAGNSTEQNAYQYTHVEPMSGTNYYRIKQVDVDGSFIFSDVVPIRVVSDNEVHIYPTAVNDFVTVTVVEEVPGDIPVLVFNSIGTLIYSAIMPAGSTELMVPAMDLDAGYYFVKMELDGIGVITKPFIKKTL